MKKIAWVTMLILLLAGCSQKTVHRGTTGFITQFVKDDQVLIGDVIYEIGHDTQLQTNEGEALKKNDLRLGMKIQPFYEGDISQAFPRRARAKMLQVQQEPADLQESAMIVNVLSQLRHNKDEHFIVTNVIHKPDEDAYVMDVMRRSNVDIGFKITVDEHNYEILFMEA